VELPPNLVLPVRLLKTDWPHLESKFFYIRQPKTDSYSLIFNLVLGLVLVAAPSIKASVCVVIPYAIAFLFPFLSPSFTIIRLLLSFLKWLNFKFISYFEPSRIYETFLNSCLGAAGGAISKEMWRMWVTGRNCW